MNFPEAVVYEGLDPEATYVVRCSGYGKFLLRMDGDAAIVAGGAVKSVAMGETAEFMVPPQSVRDRKLVLTWDRPTDEGHLNWRQHSRLAEVWLVKR